MLECSNVRGAIRGLLILLVALSAVFAGDAEPTRAEREARALAAVMAMPDGDKREAGLKILRGAYAAFRDDCAAAAQPVPEDASDTRKARLADLARRNATLAALRQAPAGADRLALAEAHLRRWPLDLEARLLLGRLHLDRGERDAALEALLAAIALEPAGDDGLRELRGRITLAGLVEAPEDKRPELRHSAANDLAPVLNRLLGAGIAAEVANDAAGADRALADLEPLLPALLAEAGQAQLIALRAGAAARAGRDAEALALWDRAAAAGVREPDPAPRRRALVRRLEAGRVAEAIAGDDAGLLRRLSPAFPENDALQDRLFRVLLLQGRLAEPRDAARELLAADPEHPLAQVMFDGCTAGLDSRRLDLLPPFFLRLRAAVPTLGARFPVVHGLLAALAEVAGDPAGAAAALDPMLEAQPDDRAVRWQRARLRLAAGDHTGAIADCEVLLKTRPEDPDVLALRGRARAATGDKAGALADADRVVAAHPTTSALHARARIRRDLGDRPGALADIAAITAAAKDASDVSPLLEAAEMAKALGDEAAQRAALERARALGSADATLQLKRMR